MEQIIGGIIVTAAGCALIVFREKFVRDMISFQNESFGLHFGKKTTDLHIKLAIPFGLLFVIIGLLILFGIFDLK